MREELNVAVNHPNNETRTEKLARKKRQREQWYKSTGTPMVLANLSVNHQDYGMTPADHLAAKEERENIS